MNNNAEIPDTYLCPFIDKCEFYKNWESQKTNRVDVVYKTKQGTYGCITKFALTISEEKGGITLNEGLAKKLVNKSAGCSWIENLNMIYQQGIFTKKLYDFFNPAPKQKPATKPVQSTTAQQGNKISTSVIVAPIIPTQNGRNK